MRGSRNFWQGGGGGVQTETFFSPQLILQRGGGGAMVLLQRKLYFLKDPEGGPTFSERGEERIILLVLARITILAFRWHSS